MKTLTVIKKSLSDDNYREVLLDKIQDFDYSCHNNLVFLSCKELETFITVLQFIHISDDILQFTGFKDIDGEKIFMSMFMSLL